MTSTITESIRECVEPVVASAGLYLEEVVVRKAGSRSVVRITIDLDEDETGGLGSEAVADVSRAISSALDTANPVAGAYTLEVSTPGTDRRMTELRHFKRARGRLAEVTMQDGSRVSGRIVSADGALRLRGDDGDSVEVPFSEVAFGRVQVELNRGSETDSDEGPEED